MTNKIEEFIRENLKPLCKEMQEYDGTFKYEKTSIMRQLINMYGNLGNAKLLAESMVRSVAVKYVAEEA